MPKPPTRFLAGLLAASGAAASMAAPATEGAADGPAARAVPAELSVGAERLRLPGGEALGLVGTSFLVEPEPGSGWWVGPSLYGAASGHRGGLFTWGIEAQHRWLVAPLWSLVTGLYAGGGGGGNAPVGGGLMLRPHADLQLDLGGWSAALGLSEVDFPNGSIHSTQVGLRLAMPETLGFANPGHSSQATGAGSGGARADGLGYSSLELVLGRDAAGANPVGAFDLIGLRAGWRLDDAWSLTAQASAAAKGAAAGYAEFMAGLRGLWPVLPGSVPALRLGLAGSLGMGGGGAVPTGGGAMARAAALAQWRLGSGAALELEGGRVRAFSGPFDVNYLQLGIGFDVDRPARPGAGEPVAESALRETTWAAGVESYARAQRKAGGDPSLSAVSLGVRRAVDDHVYLSGRAVSAFSGGAGAYSAGLLGLGWATDAQAASGWAAGVEADAGAGGGGGVNSVGGAIIEPTAWLARSVGGAGRLQLSAGWVRSLRGGLSSPVLGLAWSVALNTR
jgi:hypothetical protein